MQRIPLRDRRGEVIAHALVDDTQFEYLNQFKWHKTHYGYAHTSSRSLPTKMRWMHQLTYQRCHGKEASMIDHIDRDRLNNQLSNLREATFFQNNLNRGLSRDNVTGYIGVRQDTRDITGRRHQVTTGIVGRQKHICYTDSPRDAAIAHDIYMRDTYPGELFYVNVPDASPEDIARVRGIMTAAKRHRNAASRYVGVYFDKRRNRWYSQMGGGKNKVFIGCFDTEIEAAKAFDAHCIANHINRPLNFTT